MLDVFLRGGMSIPFHFHLRTSMWWILMSIMVKMLNQGIRDALLHGNFKSFLYWSFIITEAIYYMTLAIMLMVVAAFVKI